MGEEIERNKKNWGRTARGMQEIAVSVSDERKAGRQYGASDIFGASEISEIGGGIGEEFERIGAKRTNG